MIGHQQVEQAALFYEFSLEKHIPVNRLANFDPSSASNFGSDSLLMQFEGCLAL